MDSPAASILKNSPRFTRSASRLVPAVLTLLLATSILCHAQKAVVLKNTFIQKYRNRVTMDIRFIVDHAHEYANQPAEDGDLHMAGRSKQVGLPMVAEIMNAKDEKEAVNAVHVAEKAGAEKSLKGIWRLWWEHPDATQDQVQGAEVPKPANTGPKHIFEIHPVLSFNGVDVSKSLKPIAGYDPDDWKAFEDMRTKECEIVPGKKTTSILTKRITHNYVKFTFEISEFEKPVSDGRFVHGNVLNPQGNADTEDIRMVFAKGTEPEKQVSKMKPGDRLTVLAIPRINLKEVWTRMKNAAKNKDALKNTLPFEMIVVGIY